MRLNQVNLSISRFGDQVPSEYPEDQMIVNIYSDSNNLYEALSDAFTKAVSIMKSYGDRVSVRCDTVTNANDSKESSVLNSVISEQCEMSRSNLDRDKALLEHSESEASCVLNINFGMLRNYISKVNRISICILETLNYENYLRMKDVPEDFDELYVYGIGMIDSEFYEKTEFVPDEQKLPENLIFRPCIEIMLSSQPKI